MRLTFRTKLLLALLGIVIPLIAVTLLVVRQETARQIDVFVADALQRSRLAFQQVEQQRQTELLQAAIRITNSNRIAGALQSALEEGDTAFLADAAVYDLSVRGVSGQLAAFTDIGGTPVLGLLEGKRLSDPRGAVPSALVRKMLIGGDSSTFGYQLLGDHLYAVQSSIVRLVDRPIGTLTIGSQIDNDVARRLAGAMLGAQVCFVAHDRCIASNANLPTALRNAMAVQPKRGVRADVDLLGRHWALIADRLSSGPGEQAWWVAAVPVDRVLMPFNRIERVTIAAAVGALALAIILDMLLSRGLAGPVHRLVRATERVARGDYDVHVETRSRDELGTLANAFNEMTHGLLLKERYRGVLDKVVSREIAEELLKGEISLGGETRAVTTLFADVRDFTAMTLGMPPEEVIALLNDIMQHAGAAIEEEGGVVDKYVGDQVMGVFGTPLSHGDDEARAVRAALRIRTAVADVSAARVARGMPAVQIGIGINTGAAVAGNMGSLDRLNYTVLGESVNLAARLCSDADGSEILITEATRRGFGDEFETIPAGARTFKGFDRPVPVFRVLSGRSAHAAHAIIALALAIGALVAGAPLNAQERALPSFADAGVRYVSPGGTVQIVPSGRIDLNAFAVQDSQPWLIPARSSFIGGRASLFVDLFIGSHIYGLAEGRIDRGEAPAPQDLQARLEQAFVRVNLNQKIGAQAGRFVSPFGSYPQRHHSSSDPLIRPPLPYDLRTLVSSSLIPVRNDGFIDWKLTPEVFRPVGAPAVWGAPYQLGAMAFATFGPATFRLARMNSAPSSEPEEWNRGFDRSNLVATVALQIVPELRIGAGYSGGPYLTDDAKDMFGEGPEDELAHYEQDIYNIEATFARGLFEARAELFYDIWDVPRVTDYPVDISYYIESRLKLPHSTFVAARYNEMRFDRIIRSTGVKEQWDYTARRLQLGAGYRFFRNADARVEWMLNRTDGPRDPRDNLFSVQLSWDF